MLEASALKLFVAHGFLAIFGAVVHAANAYRNGKSKTWADFFTLTIMASFSGVMFAIIGLHMFPEGGYMTMAMAGTGGFLGVEGMTVLADKIRNIISNNR